MKAAGIIGFDLFSEKQYSSNYRILYKVSGGNKKMCGSNTWPAAAKKLIERVR